MNGLPAPRVRRYCAAGRLLELSQKAALSILIVVVCFRFYLVLWQTLPQVTVLEEMRAIVLFLGDYVLLGLGAVTAVRLVVDALYRGLLLTYTQNLIEGGGISWFALLLWTGLGVLWAHEPVLVRYGTLQLAAELLMGIILAGLVSRGWLQMPLWAMVAGATAQSLLALAQTLHQGPLGWPILYESPLRLFSVYRPFGLTINPNNLAGYLVPGIFACLILLRQRQPRAARQRLLLACGLLISCGLLATQSRAALAGTGAGLLWVALRLRLRLTRRAWLILIAGAVVLGLWGGVLLAGNYRDRLDLTQREFLLADTWAVLRESPLFGVGIHNLVLAIAALHQGEPSLQLLLPAHNTYMVIWAELGLPGLLLFVAGGAVLIIRSRRQAGVAVVLLGGCLLAFGVIMLFDFYFWDDHRSRTLLFWIIGLWWGYSFREQPDSASRLPGTS